MDINKINAFQVENAFPSYSVAKICFEFSFLTVNLSESPTSTFSAFGRHKKHQVFLDSSNIFNVFFSQFIIN